jgi:hypothetical protein
MGNSSSDASKLAINVLRGPNITITFAIKVDNSYIKIVQFRKDLGFSFTPNYIDDKPECITKIELYLINCTFATKKDRINFIDAMLFEASIYYDPNLVKYEISFDSDGIFHSDYSRNPNQVQINEI